MTSPFATNLFGQERDDLGTAPNITLDRATIRNSVFSPGLEIYSPAQTPFIDFHMAANSTADAGADYNVRLTNNATGWLSLLGNFNVSATMLIAGRSYFSDGLELAHASSTPFIDFHRSADPREATDYNIRLIHESVDQLTMHTSAGGRWGAFKIASGTIVGAYGWDSNWSHFGSVEAANAQNNYAFMSNRLGDILVNTFNSKPVILAVNGTARLYVRATLTETNAAMFFANYANASGTHAERPIQTRGVNTQGISIWNQAQGIAPQIWADVGDQFHLITNPGTAYAPIKASAFNVSSTLRDKTNVRTLEKGARDRVKKLRPIRFKREHTPCANCKGKGKISPAEYLEHVHGAQRTEDTPANLLKPQPCPLCSQNGTPGKVNTPTVDLNEDSDFLSFAAEELAEIVPEAVTWEPTDRLDPMSAPRPGGIDMMALLTVAIATIQELDARLDALEGSQ